LRNTVQGKGCEMKKMLVVSIAAGVLFVFSSGLVAAVNKSGTPMAGQAAKQSDKTPLKKDLEAISVISGASVSAYNAANSGKWNAVASNVRRIRKTALESNLAQIIGGDDTGKINSSLDALEKAASAKDRKSALVAANQLSLAMIYIAGKYNPAIPMGISLLEYYGRELQIWSAFKDPEKLRSTVKDISATWDVLKGPVRARGGIAEEKVISALVFGLEKASSNDEVMRIYPQLLKQVSRLEKLFK